MKEDPEMQEYKRLLESMPNYQESGRQSVTVGEGVAAIGHQSGSLYATLSVGGVIRRISGETNLDLDRRVAVQFENLASASIKVKGGDFVDGLYVANGAKPEQTLKVSQVSGPVNINF
jgi:transketolase N-terminal domain/subunit